MRKEDFVKLIKNAYDKVQNKDISESIEEGLMELDFVKIKGKFYYIYHSFRVELEDFIREKTVKE